jgi:hypothetical protein
MADLNLQLVREFFELNMFSVFTNWQRDPAHQRPGEGSVQLFVENTNHAPRAEPGFVLDSIGLPAIERAVVEVRAWHADRFYPSVIEASPVLSHFVDDTSLALAREVFHGQTFSTILVVSELPNSVEPRGKSIRLLQDTGIGHILEFPIVLQDLLEKVSVNGNYDASPTLQTLRLLKRYRFIRNQQMEFSFATEPPATGLAPVVDTALEADASGERPPWFKGLHEREAEEE